MKKLTILTDMDDTIEDLLEAWLSYLNDKHGLNVCKDDVREWDMTAAFPSLQPDDVFTPLYDNSLWESVRPMPYASEILERLKEDGHDIYVVTSAHYKSVEAKLERVLFRYFPFFDWTHVIIASNKQLIKGDVLIDDAPHNLIDGDYYKVLMDAPHNRDFDEHSIGAVRVFSWLDVYNVIQKLAGGDNHTERSCMCER